MLVVGLTGGIGAGKSTVAGLLAGHGVLVVDADLVARQVLEQGGPALAAVARRFGPAVLRADGSLDRAALAALVFADENARRDLEALVHPAVRQGLAQRVADRAGTDDVVVLEVPLLAESGRDTYALDVVVVVDTPVDTAVARLGAGRGMSEADARARVAAQAGRAQRVALADLVIDNAGPPEALVAQVERAWAWLQGRALRDS